MKFHQATVTILWIGICTSLGKEARTDWGDVCKEKECTELVSQMTTQMGPSRACDNFYTYVCGKWNGSRELKEKDIKVKAVKDLIELLKNAVSSCSKPFNATNKLINAFKSCAEKGKEEGGLRAAVKDILNTYQLGDWPVKDEAGNDNYKDILKKTGPLPIFYYFIPVGGPPATLVMSKPIEFFLSGWSISGNEASLSRRDDNEEVEYNYDDLDAKSDEAYKSFIIKSISLINPAVSEEERQAAAERIITFEKKLSEFASKASSEAKNMTLSELSTALGDNIPMDQIMQRDFTNLTITIKNTTRIEVQYLDYYKNVTQYLRTANTTAMKDYILWTKVKDMAVAEDTPLHSIYMEYKHNTSIFGENEIKTTEDPDMLCLHQLLKSDVMYSAVANFYSKHKFDNVSRQEALKILGFVNITFKYIIENNQWMSNETKAKAVERLNKMRRVIGYPEWLINDTVINSLYQFVPDIGENESFVKHFFYLQQNDRYQKLLKLGSKYIDKEYEEVALRSHAFYDELTETIAYPAASLVTHFRMPPIPRSVNFGTIGTIFAQLLTTAMDRHFKARVNGTIIRKEFWDNNTTTNFCKNSKCLNNSEQCSDQGECYSASYQKLLDYTGVRVSHKAMERSKSQYNTPFLLNNDTLNTEDMIFFTAFGSLYCPYSVNEAKGVVVQARAETERDDFPNSLNEIVSIYKKFNETFNCTGDVSDECNLIPDEPLQNSGC